MKNDQNKPFQDIEIEDTQQSQNISSQEEPGDEEKLIDKQIRGLLVEIEYLQEESTDMDYLEAESIARISILLTNLITQKKIQGVYTKQCQLVKDITDYDE